MIADKTLRENARLKQHKDATSYNEQKLEAISHKTVWPLTSLSTKTIQIRCNMTNHPNKMNMTCKALLENQWDLIISNKLQ